MSTQPSGRGRIDVDALRADVDLAEVVGRYVKLKKNGREYHGLCPFHDERSASFTVNPAKGFVHCFGCGAHHDVVGFLMRVLNIEFRDACEQLGHREFGPAAAISKAPVRPRERDTVWVPLLPVPDDAPPLVGDDGWTLGIWNEKKRKFSRMKPARADAYRDGLGRLLGYVLRIAFDDGSKITPTVTWCVGPSGIERWCMRPFPVRRPMFGLDALALQIAHISGGPLPRRLLIRAGQVVDLADGEHVERLEWPPVLVVEGEKCRAAGASALPQYAVVSWPGGSKGIGHVDWRGLQGRAVVLWPDADKGGRDAMLGWIDHSGLLRRGVAQHAHAQGATSIRMVDPDGMPAGWDIADALDPDRDAWSPRQLAAWAASRVVAIDIVIEPTRSAR